MRDVNPTTPCAPGRQPVPRLVRLVAVVDGTPQVIGSRAVGERVQVGRLSGCARSRFQPSPSTRKTTYDVGRGQARARWPSRAPRAAATADGSTSVERAAAVARAALRRRRRRQGWTVAALRAAREVEQGVDGLGAVGARADPQREVLGREHAAVAVVGDAVGVAAGRRLEVDPADGAPADGEHRLGDRWRRCGAGLRSPGWPPSG